MERQLTEDSRQLWKLAWIFAMFPLALLLVNIFVTGEILSSLEIGGIIICVGLVFQWLSSLWPGERPRWFLTNDGLKRIDTSGNQEVIKWDQIYWMKWLRYYGLMLQWKSEDSMRPQASSERARLGLSEKDAQEILLLWKDARG